MKRSSILGSLVLAVCLSGYLTSAVFGQKTAGAAKGVVSVCKEIDDDWKCVGESATWAVNTIFNVLFVNPTAVGQDVIGIVIHKQDSTGKDVDFINEYQQNIGEENRKYATVGDNFKLPAGVYSIYIIAWPKRELLTHNGNFTDYLAKTVLTLK